MARKTIDLATAYAARLGTLDATCTKVEGLFARSELSQDDMEQVYAGMFVAAFSEFETLIEKLFLALLEDTHTSSNATTVRRIEIRPANLAREVLFEGRAYLDWLPIEKHTKKRSDRFLNRGEPFSLLDSKDNSLINCLNALRNAVAHRSEAARKSFEATIASLPLLPDEKTPTGYLRSRPYGGSGPTQFEIAIGELIRIAHKLCQ